MLSDIFTKEYENRKPINKSSRYIMLVELDEIIKNRIQIEALVDAVIAIIYDSDDDSSTREPPYLAGLAAAIARWEPDRQVIHRLIYKEEMNIRKWDKEYKKKLRNTPRQSKNMQEQMKADQRKIKRYDSRDQQHQNVDIGDDQIQDEDIDSAASDNNISEENEATSQPNSNNNTMQSGVDWNF